MNRLWMMPVIAVALWGCADGGLDETDPGDTGVADTDGEDTDEGDTDEGDTDVEDTDDPVEYDYEMRATGAYEAPGGMTVQNVVRVGDSAIALLAEAAPSQNVDGERMTWHVSRWVLSDDRVELPEPVPVDVDIVNPVVVPMDGLVGSGAADGHGVCILNRYFGDLDQHSMVCGTVDSDGGATTFDEGLRVASDRPGRLSVCGEDRMVYLVQGAGQVQPQVFPPEGDDPMQLIISASDGGPDAPTTVVDVRMDGGRPTVSTHVTEGVQAHAAICETNHLRVLGQATGPVGGTDVAPGDLVVGDLATVDLDTGDRGIESSWARLPATASLDDDGLRMGFVPSRSNQDTDRQNPIAASGFIAYALGLDTVDEEPVEADTAVLLLGGGDRTLNSKWTVDDGRVADRPEGPFELVPGAEDGTHWVLGHDGASARGVPVTGLDGEGALGFGEAATVQIGEDGNTDVLGIADTTMGPMALALRDGGEPGCCGHGIWMTGGEDLRLGPVADPDLLSDVIIGDHDDLYVYELPPGRSVTFDDGETFEAGDVGMVVMRRSRGYFRYNAR